MSNIGKDGNGRDRAIGEYWEDRFIEIAKSYGWEAWPFNRMKGATFEDEYGNRYVSPDVWVLRRYTKQYICEIKHKNLARNGCYGFELYREESMLKIERNYSNEFGPVVALYVVHNHDLAGGKYTRDNDPLHWHAAKLSVLALEGHEGAAQHTCYNSKVSEGRVRMKYYPYRLFRPIQWFLEIAPDRQQKQPTAPPIPGRAPALPRSRAAAPVRSRAPRATGSGTGR